MRTYYNLCSARDGDGNGDSDGDGDGDGDGMLILPIKKHIRMYMFMDIYADLGCMKSFLHIYI